MEKMAQISAIEPYRTVEKLIALSSERARKFLRRGNLYRILGLDLILTNSFSYSYRLLLLVTEFHF